MIAGPKFMTSRSRAEEQITIYSTDFDPILTAQVIRCRIDGSIAIPRYYAFSALDIIHCFDIQTFSEMLKKKPSV